MTSWCLLVEALVVGCLASAAQDAERDKNTYSLTLVELNGESLFDTNDDTTNDDDDFTPNGRYKWTHKRYWSKLNNIAKEILSCGEIVSNTAIPDLIALTEVENDSVLTDLTRHTLLYNAGYEYITFPSPDVRGLDVALLYSPLTFAPIKAYPLRVTPVRGMRPTRDILYVEGRTAYDDTLHIFVVHAPSRLGGEYATRPARQTVAERLLLSVDSLQTVCPEANIIIAGDFNDPPDGPSLKGLYARSLANLSALAKGEYGAQGTYKYKGQWENIDHIFVSAALTDAICRINDHGALLTDDEEYGSVRPNRNFYHVRWMDGFSDHLPLVALIRLHK